MTYHFQLPWFPTENNDSQLPLAYPKLTDICQQLEENIRCGSVPTPDANGHRSSCAELQWKQSSHTAQEWGEDALTGRLNSSEK